MALLRGRRSGTARQRGLSLLFALMALVALSLAAVALIRSVDTGGKIMGNLGFKQDATVSADQAAEQAIAWLITHAGATLETDVPASGYYGVSLDALDVTGRGSTSATRSVVDWKGDGCASYASGSYGLCKKASDEITINGTNKARYVIMRLCRTEGPPDTSDCAVPIDAPTTSSSNKGDCSFYKDCHATLAVAAGQYYRIVVRSQSARGTVAFTETIVTQ